MDARTEVWLIPTEFLRSLDPRLKEIWKKDNFQALNNLDAIYDQIFTPEKLFARIVNHLQKTEPNLKRGDMIFLEPELGDRNNGKYFYDGSKMIPFAMELDDYGHIPDEFQVITEFPIHYWADQIDHNTFVPFNVSSNFDTINESEIAWLELEDDTEVPYFYFTTEDNETYYLVGDYFREINNPEEYSKEELTEAFVDTLNNAEFFNTESEVDFEFPLANPDHVLYLGITM